MKKVFAYILLFLFITILTSSFIFAQEEQTKQEGQTNFEVLREKISEATSQFNLSGNFSILLFGLLVWMVLYSVLSQMDLFENSIWLSSAVALIITLLSFIYIPKDLLDAQGPLYAALGGTIVTLIPFVITVYFTLWVTRSITLARVIWGIFALYYLIIFFFAPVDFDQGNTVNLPLFGTVPLGAVFYGAAFIASILLFIFIAPIRRTVWKEHLKSVEERVERRTKMFGLGLRAGEAAAREASRPRRAGGV